MRLRWLLLPPTLLVAACAHEQVAQTAPQPIVAQPAPPVPDASPQAKADDTAELQRLLTGPIAHFDFDQARLTSDDRQKLQTLAAAMKTHPAARIRIAGNCDELGTEEYNLALGQKRAEVARKYLAELGVASTRLETISYGENRPAVEGHDDAAHAANRRDDAELLSTR
jgi:peptidoglycan-associated lipoprotein